MKNINQDKFSLVSFFYPFATLYTVSKCYILKTASQFYVSYLNTQTLKHSNTLYAFASSRAYVALFLCVLCLPLCGQNIPRANHSGPYGIQANTYTGNLYLDRTDLYIPNQGLSLDIAFTYNSFRDTIDYGYGKGWTFSLGICYEIDSTNSIIIHHADGRSDRYEQKGNAYQNPQGIFDELTYSGSQLLLTTKHGMRYYFENSAHKKLTKIIDLNDNVITLNYSNGYPNRITDPSGRVVDLQWRNNHLVQLTDANANRNVQYVYNASGQLLQVTDAMGYQKHYGYNVNKQLTSVTNEKGYIADIRYDQADRVVLMNSCIGKMRFSYDERKTFVIEEGKSRQVTTYEYDEDGKLLGKKGNCCGYDTQYQYDSDNNLSNLTDANGASYQSNHDANGNVLLSKDAQGAQLRFDYTAPFNRLTQLTDKRGNTTQMQYDSKGNLTGIQQPEGVQLAFDYDANGNLAEFSDGEGQVTAMDYNANNDLTAITYPIGQTTFTYDEVGNMLESTDPNNHGTRFDYDALNRITAVRDALDHYYRFTYDAASNLTKEIDANGNTKTYDYDAYSRLTAVTTASGTTQYDYDAFDNLTRILDANGHASSFIYNDRNLLTEEKDALGHSTRYAYDGNGNVIAQRDANGNDISYTYDALNRLTSKSYLGNTDTYEYDKNGNLIRCANQNISISFQYDALNRLTQKSVDNWNKSIQYTYDKAGNRSSMTDPDGGITRYTYDANNRLIQITTPQNEMIGFTYDLGGRMIRQDNANGTYATYTYDAADRLLSLQHHQSDATIFASYTYTYDKNGNRLSMTEQDGSLHQYEYDGDNRLTKVTYPDSSVETYTFDAMGNRLSLMKGDQTTTYTYDAADRLLSANDIQFRYDANGNLIQKIENEQTTIYRYNGENRLIAVGRSDNRNVRYQYDPFGNRIQKSMTGEGAVRYLLDGDNVLQKLDLNGQTLTHYTAGIDLDSWLSMRKANATYVYHADGLGSIRALTGDDQSLTSTYQYDAYGNITAQTGTVENVYTYTGREWDQNTNLFYYRTRYLESHTGRFTSRDKFPFIIKLPSTLNRYSYVYNNPLLYNDPTGEIAPAVLIGLSIFGWGAVDFSLQLHRYGGRFGCIDYYDVALSGVLGGAGIGLLGAVRSGALLSSPFLRSLIAKSSVGLGFFKNALRWSLKKGFDNIKSLGFWRHREIIKRARKGIILHPSLFAGAFFAKKRQLLSAKKCEAEKGLQDIPDDLKYLMDSILIPIIRPIDPNEILPPPSYGAEKWVSYQANLPYTILFENDPDFATAAAQQVKITHEFDEDINPFTFRLGSFGFGDYVFEVPPNLSYYNNQFDFRDSLGLVLKVIAGVDIAQNQAFWLFESVDPKTGLAESLPAEAGFLPVNDTLIHNGEGFVNFTVQAKADSQTGDEILAKAFIVFDDNPPIITNEVFNTIDADHPQSTISQITTNPDSTEYQLHWQGSDIGSGIRDYTLYVATNEDRFLPTTPAIIDTTYTFIGNADSTYQFLIGSRDQVGNIEHLNFEGAASLRAKTNTGEAIINNRSTLVIKELLIHRLYPVPTEQLLAIEFDSPSPQVFLSIHDLNGKRLLRRMIEAEPQQTNQLELVLKDIAAGTYVLSLQTKERKVSALFVKI